MPFLDKARILPGPDGLQQAQQQIGPQILRVKLCAVIIGNALVVADEVDNEAS